MANPSKGTPRDEAWLNIIPESKLDQAIRRHRLIAGPSEEALNQHREELLRKRVDFIERYGGGYATPNPPFKMRLTYGGFCQQDFVINNAIELVFNLFQCCQDLLDEYKIVEAPDSITLSVFREPWRHPTTETRISPPMYDPNRGQWIEVMALTVHPMTPFFSFEELELNHLELWLWIPEYARRKMNPCSEIPLVEQKLGSFLAMG